MYIFFLKSKVLFVFFFKNCFCSKSHIFVKKKSYDLKNHTQGTSGGTLKICRRNLKKNQFLLIFDDFGEKLHFWPNFWICGEHCWGHKIVGNRQTQKKFFFQVEKFMENMFDILKYASECQIDAIFVIKIFWLLGTKSQKMLPRIYRSL